MLSHRILLPGVHNIDDLRHLSRGSRSGCSLLALLIPRLTNSGSAYNLDRLSGFDVNANQTSIPRPTELKALTKIDRCEPAVHGQRLFRPIRNVEIAPLSQAGPLTYRLLLRVREYRSRILVYIVQGHLLMAIIHALLCEVFTPEGSELQL